MRYVFTPSEKAFGKQEVMRSIDVELDVETGDFFVNGRRINSTVKDHAAAFGIKQMLANSYASAGTAKNKEGGLLPLSERLALWQGSFDKVLAKLVDPATKRNWQDVFTEGATREPTDPVEAEIARIVRSKLVAWAGQKGKKLPKADSDEYKGLVARVLEKQGATIRATAESIVAARGDVDDIDLDESDDDTESDNETPESESDLE